MEEVLVTFTLITSVRYVLCLSSCLARLFHNNQNIRTTKPQRKMNTLIGNKIVFCYCFLILVSFSCDQSRAQEVENEREFSYDENAENGPANWGTIHPEWSECSNGNMQSPIDLLHERVEVVSYLGRLHRDYQPSNATLVNRGHDMMLTWVGGAGHLLINGTSYQLNQCHWHSPSEHSIDGKRYPLEAHLVHQSADGKIAVIGILYEIGRPDPFLSMMENDFRALVNTTDLEKVVGIIDPKQIKLGSRKYYRYIGSLTTPPCTQNVTWTIVKKVRTVAKDQVQILREAVHDNSESNARPIQPLNNRWIKMSRPKVDEEH